MERELSSGTLAIDSLGRVLLVRPLGRRKWAIPKGHVEQDETPEQAAARETYEEARLRVRIVRAVPGFRLDNRFCHKDVSVFLAVIVDGTPEPDGVETEEARLFRLDELPEVIQSQALWLQDVLPLLRSFVVEQVTHEATADVAQHVNRVPVVEQHEPSISCHAPVC
jgi:ADP-ribose pyrophosphatase YjhB (NUDIX family)